MNYELNQTNVKQNRLQNKVAGSVFTLPFCAIAAIGMWWLPQRAFDVRCLLGLLFCLLTTYIIMETNARQHIIRIRTRMMSCVWLVLAASLSFMHPLGEPVLAATLLSISYLLLFRCYQRHRPQAIAFHAFLMLSLGSFFAPVMLPMAIPFFLYLVIFLRSMTKRAFWAGILGLAVPYWCYAVWCFVTKDMQSFLARLTDMVQFEMPSVELLTSMPLVRQVSAGVVALLSIISILHYLQTKYDDKIRVRMILYIYVSQTVLLMAFLLAQPAHYETTMALLLASASPLIAHYFSLSGSWLTTIFFLLSVLLTAGMATLNLWLTSFTL
ncbi:MAG: hypothetical protein J6W03_09130 [Bacteroidaceae bacterium]|nr:hypothetical protein [Bacteroidaceae bacterium]